MVRIAVILSILFISYSAYSQTKFSERDYTNYIQSLIGGKTEFKVKGGRADLVTEKYAFEIEKANNWKESIGQSIWYALNTNKQAGIILVLENDKDYKYVIQLSTALGYAKLDDVITVLVFPNDFKDLINEKSTANNR